MCSVGYHRFLNCHTYTCHPCKLSYQELIAWTQVFWEYGLCSLSLRHSDYRNNFASLIFLLQRVFFKLRDLRPCCLANISFNVDLPDEDEINVSCHVLRMTDLTWLSLYTSCLSCYDRYGVVSSLQMWDCLLMADLWLSPHD